MFCGNISTVVEKTGKDQVTLLLGTMDFFFWGGGGGGGGEGRSSSSSLKVFHEWLATLRENNRTNNRSHVLALKTIATTTLEDL